MDGWVKVTREEAERAAHQEMGGKFETHILAQWLGPQATREPRSQVTLFEDGSVQIYGAAPIDLLAHVQSAWFNHQHGGIA